MAPGGTESFWNVRFGDVVTLASMLLAFYLAHRANVRRIEEAASRMANLETRVNLIFKWFEANVIERKLD